MEAFENSVHYQTMVSYRMQGLNVGAYLLKRSPKTPYSLTFGFECQGIHSFLSDEQFERAFNALESGLNALPNGETLTIHLGAYKSDRSRQKTLDELIAHTNYPELEFLLHGEKARVAELTKSGLREPKTLHIFATHRLSQTNQEKHWTDKISSSYQKIWSEFTGDSQSFNSTEQFLRGAWGKGFLHWKNILEQQLELKLQPMTDQQMWDYQHYRLNSRDIPSLPVPQTIVVQQDQPLQEIIRSRRHGTTLLLQTEPEYTKEYVKLGDDYLGVLTFWDKPGAWSDKRHQLPYLCNLVAHDIVTDTEIIVQLQPGDDKKLNWKLSRLTKQGLAKSNYRQSKNDVDVASKLKAQLGEEAQLRILMGEVPIYVSVVFLVRRKSLNELEDACRFIQNSFKRPAWVVRERQITWDVWRQTLPIVDEPLLVSMASGFKTDRRMQYLKQETMGFLPLVKTYSRDNKGLELIAEDGGTPIHLDLFSPGNDKHRHVLVLGTTRSGKSVLVGGLITQALSHNVPIVALDYPKETGESTYSAYTRFMEGFGAYFNVAQESINLFEIPNLYRFSPEIQKIRLTAFKDFLVTCLQAMVVLDSPDILLNQTIRTCLYDAINNFFENRAIQKNYRKALTASFGSKDKQKIPTLKIFLLYLMNLINKGFFKVSNREHQLAETLTQKALDQILLRLKYWTNSMVGKAISQPSSVRTNALLTVLALTNVSDNEDAAILSLVAYAFSLKRAMEFPLSIFFIDESPILFKFNSVRQIVESIIANGAKSGIRCIISAQSPDKIATSKEGMQILSNINTKLIGKVVNSAVDNICSILKYPREMVLACAEKFKMNPYYLYSQWLLEDDGKMSFCRYYVPYVHLGLVANNQDEQSIREEFEKAYTDKYEAMSYFSRALVKSIQSGQPLGLVAKDFLPLPQQNIHETDKKSQDFSNILIKAA
ncbi:hypothetical protein C7H19_15340 [Aphanothece hegewaldii CCALA 016]|uniref:Helicase HerA central domain-containing protein n=2 Tax=Aphanothece TaxID=1121 RepID=A0A2T1LVP8_9CHRO|nr:hypothetical protein C7H19_15340 [Aphanothece hegewaldii CCALA 016]